MSSEIEIYSALLISCQISCDTTVSYDVCWEVRRLVSLKISGLLNLYLCLVAGKILYFKSLVVRRIW